MDTHSSYGAFEAKTHFSALLDKVEHQHEKIAITRHGKVVAHLVPAEQEDEDSRLKAMLRDARERARLCKPLGKLTAKDLIEEGRRTFVD